MVVSYIFGHVGFLSSKVVVGSLKLLRVQEQFEHQPGSRLAPVDVAGFHPEGPSTKNEQFGPKTIIITKPIATIRTPSIKTQSLHHLWYLESLKEGFTDSLGSMRRQSY